MKRQTSERKWVGGKRSREKLGTSQLTEPSTSGRRPPKRRPRRSLLDNQRGPIIYMRQKAGEIQAHRAFEKGAEKWHKEHIPRKGKGDISEEGQELLEDKDKWRDKASLSKACYESRKRERINEDGSFLAHQKGPITSTYTSDWFLREGEHREIPGE